MRVAVLGAGLQGACVAMELASAGVAVDLYDKNERCVSQASARNEGKIHLGYLYANDRSLATARTMVKGALAFAPLMRRWVGRAIDAVAVSSPFSYLVHTESLLDAGEVERHLEAAHALVLEEAGDAVPDYFGSDPRVPPSRLSAAECAPFDRTALAGAFRTAEIAVDPEALAEIVRERLAGTSNIRCRLQAHVRGAGLSGGGVVIDFEQAGKRARERYDHVVNTLWDGRLAIDQTVGLAPDVPWLYRVKHYVRLRAPALAAQLPSTTIVLGPFGDIAAYRNGNFYLSWYPAGMRGASSALSPPEWPLVLDESAAAPISAAILAGLARVVPAVGDITPDAVEFARVQAGIIFAWGRTDIHDRASGLHARHAIGPRSRGPYHTVDTGKLTMAPLFGKMIADRIRQAG